MGTTRTVYDYSPTELIASFLITTERLVRLGYRGQISPVGINTEEAKAYFVYHKGAILARMSNLSPPNIRGIFLSFKEGAFPFPYSHSSGGIELKPNTTYKVRRVFLEELREPADKLPIDPAPDLCWTVELEGTKFENYRYRLSSFEAPIT